MKTKQILLNKSNKNSPSTYKSIPPITKLNLDKIKNPTKKTRDSLFNQNSGVTQSVLQNSYCPQSKNNSKLTSKRSSIQPQKRQTPVPNSLQSSIANIIKENKQKLVEKKIEEKYLNKELDRLLKERDALRNALCNIIDIKTSEIISQKMISLSKKINKLLRLNNGAIETEEKDDIESELKEEDSFWKKRNDSLNISKEEFDNDLFSKLSDNDNKMTKRSNTDNKLNKFELTMKEYFEKNNKIDQIFKEIELIEQNKKIDKKKKYNVLRAIPNFFFLREPKEETYVRSAKCDNTLKLKSYRPKGFRTEKLTITIPNKKPTISLEKRNSLVPKNKRSKSATLNRDILGEKGSLFITRGYTPLKETRQWTIRSTGSLRNTFGTFLKNTNFRSEIQKRFRKLLMDLMKENTKNYEHFSKVLRKKMKDDKDFKKNIENEITNLEKNFYLRKEKKVEGLSDSEDEEEENRKFLKKIDKRARMYFINYFKDVAFERRLLNKQNDDEITFYEQKLAHIKMQKEFRSIAYQTMHIEGVKITEDIEYMKKELVKDVFSVENIEWQVKKHNVLKKLRNKNR